MVLHVGDLIEETSTTTGTGDLTTSSVSGRRTFSTEFGTGSTLDLFYYFIANESAAEWEIGTGHMSGATTLVRDTVLESSNSNALVNFGAGTKRIVNDFPANRQISIGVVASLPYATP